MKAGWVDEVERLSERLVINEVYAEHFAKDLAKRHRISMDEARVEVLRLFDVIGDPPAWSVVRPGTEAACRMVHAHAVAESHRRA